MSTTVSSGSTATFGMDAFASLAVVPSASDTRGTITFTSAAPNSRVPSFSAKLQAKEFGPFLAPMTVSIVVEDGSCTYQLTGNTGGYQYDSSGNVTGLVGPGGGNIAITGGKYPILATFPGLIAFWDFSEPRAPYVSKAGIGGPLPLIQGTDSRVSKGTRGPFSSSVVFNGTSDYLYIPEANVGALNIGGNGGAGVTVIAWYSRLNSTGAEFIAGCWDENGNRRQYGLFVDLPTYGGSDKVCMHISKTGEATPGYPYNKDYANSSSTEPSRTGEWIAGTYDGAEIRAYIEALFDPYYNYTDGLANTYDKNPYQFSEGLNTAATGFYVGANPVDPTWNFCGGEIGALAVFNRALTAAEIAAFQNALNPSTLGFRHTMHQWNTTITGVSAIYGCGAYLGATATDQSTSGAGVFRRSASGSPLQHFIYRPNSGTAGIGLFTSTNLPADALTTANLKTITWQMANADIGDTVRFAIKIDDAWYATDATYVATQASASGSDWSLADTHSITFAQTAANWRDVTLTVGSTLTLAGSARGSDLPDGEITGFGIYSPAVPAGNVRVRNFEFFTL